jgi:NAD+ synthase
MGSFSGRSAAGNIKSRLRMCALYAEANANGYLVCGTTNLTELTTGYYTKYGDGGVDIEPLAGLLKREVRAIASALGVSERIINKRPSAGLYQGQFDEDELGYPYEALDDATSSLVLGTNFKVPPVARDDVNSRMAATEHKRRMPPHAMGCVVRR